MNEDLILLAKTKLVDGRQAYKAQESYSRDMSLTPETRV